jgi:aminopeptidase N
VASLTREEARERAQTIRVTGYAIRLDLDTGPEHFASTTVIRFDAVEGRETFVEVAPHQLRSATLNGAPLDLDVAFSADAGRLRLADLRAENELTVDALMSYSRDGEGLHRHVDPADDRPYLYAMSFLAAAPRWFACFDQPDLKAPVSLEVSCPADWVVFGNAPADQVEPGRWRLATTRPLATYFTTLVAGPYHVRRDSHDGIPLGLVARQSLAEHLDRDADTLFAHTKHCLDWLHELFGVRYPWGEYNQAFVPEFNAGAMENPGCVTFRDTMVFRSRVIDDERLSRDVTVAHEMAHMWFGDLVTMRWWDDLWLNESFAEYLGHRVTGDPAWVGFGIERKSWGFTADRRPSTHPVAGNGAADAAGALSEFDGISYAKGASVLRQLALHLGDEVFLDGLRRYIRSHAEGNAEFAQLLAAWTEAGAVELDEWATQWLRTTGVDELSVRDGAVVRSSPDGSARVHTIEVASFDDVGTRLAAVRATVSSERTPVDVSGELVVPDALDETWAKIALSADDWQRLPLALGGILEARTRVALWNGLQLGVADAEVAPQLALDIVTAALPAEHDDGVIATVGRWATRTLAGCYLPDAARAEAHARLAGAALGLAIGAAPGSARQLAAIRLAIGVVSDATRLHQWLAGENLPEGVVMDTELRWLVVRRLAATGAVDEEFIAAEAARDKSTQGAVHAAYCRASLPDLAAKDAAWTTLMTDDERANYELFALAQGFWQPNQVELTEPFVSRYFDEIEGLAKLRSGFLAERLASMAYPWPVVSESTLEQTQQLLARDGLDGQIRRAVVDAGDDLRRAARARGKYA